MCVIELEAARWERQADFYAALLPAIGAPKWLGHSPDALIDSMIWGGINSVKPPYTVRIHGTAKLSQELQDHVNRVKNSLRKACEAYCDESLGFHIDVRLEVVP